MAEQGQVFNLSQRKRQSHFVSTIYNVPQVFGRNVFNLSLTDLRRKKQVFVDQYLGLFLVELGLFCHFVPGLLAIALGPKPSPVTRIAGIGLGTRLALFNLFSLTHDSEQG